MKNIRNQDGCWNCKFIFVHYQQDEPDHWYCNITNDRPRHGDYHPSNYKESHTHDLTGRRLSEEELLRRVDAWYDWIKNKEVKPYQICDNWSWR